MALSSVQKDLLNKLVDHIPALRKGQLKASDGGDIALGDALGALASKPTGIAAIGTTVDLVAPGSLAAAAPLAGTEARLDVIEAKVDALIAALKA
jgi:hypothetical protein